MVATIGEEYTHEEWVQANEETIAALKVAGAVVPDDFKGRVVFKPGSQLNNGPHNPFPIEPCRLTLMKTAPDQVGMIEVGENTTLSGICIVSYRSVTIGKDVLFGPNVTILDCDGHPSDRRLPDNAENKYKASAPVVIEDNAWIGMGATIMKGVTIGHHAVVAAHAVVVKDVPPHGVVGGNPAKLLKEYK